MTPEQRLERARRVRSTRERLARAPTPARAPTLAETIHAEAAHRTARGILVDGVEFAPGAADALRLADLIGDYKARPDIGLDVRRLWIGDQQFELALRDIDAAAARHAQYLDDVREAARAAIADATPPSWPTRPNMRTTG